MSFKDKVEGCWLGKAVAGGLGAPFEGTPYPPGLSVEDLRLDTGPNDDLELQLLWLTYLERHGASLDSAKLADAWINFIKYGMDEYGVAIRNLKRGLNPPESGFVDNYFTDGMGAAIRTEIWANACPGRPAAAAWFARQDSQIDHCGEGVYAPMFLAASESAAFETDSLTEAFGEGLKLIPDDSKVACVVRTTMDSHADGVPFDEALDAMMSEFGSHNFTDCVMNLGIITLALLYGDGDFDDTVLMAVNSAFDTDCTAATCGAFLGILGGAPAIPAKWRDGMSDEIVVSPFLRELPIPKTIAEMTERVLVVADSIKDDPALAGPFPKYEPITEMPYPFESSSWRIVKGLDNEEADALAECAELADAGEVHSFDGIHMELANIADLYSSLDLFADVEIGEDLECQLMVCVEAGMTVWLDGRVIINQHNRRKPLPSFHRVEGGASVRVALKAGQRHRLRIRLIFCRPPLVLTVAFADFMNQYLDACISAT